MKVIKTKILDPTHLELSQAIQSPRGISIEDDVEENRLWRDVAKKHFLDAYEAEDAIYDEI